MSKFWSLVQWTAGGLAPLLLIGSASAAIIGGTITTTTANSAGAVFAQLGPQAMVGGVGIPVAGKNVMGMNERTGVTLGGPLAVDGGMLATGTKVDSHIVWSNFTATSGIVAKVQFAHKILGIITTSQGALNYLGASNPVVGLLTTTYLNANNWGMENGAVFAGLREGVVISGTNEITFTSTGMGPDYVRVLTAVPEPGSVAILSLGAVGLIAAGYRRRRNRTTV